MSTALQVKDLTVFEPRDEAEGRWLGRLQEHVRADGFVIRMGEAAAREEDFIVYRNGRGQWSAGRYIGEIAYEGRRIEIAPRFGSDPRSLVGGSKVPSIS